MDLRDAAAYHLLVLSSEGIAPATQRNYQFYWERLIAGFEALGIELDPINLDTNNVRSVLNWYRGEVRGTSRGGAVGVQQFARRAKLFSRFLENEGILPADTLTKLRVPRVAKILREPFTAPEVNAMWGACRHTRAPERDEALFLLLLDTGMRIGEAATITMDRLRLDQRHIIVGREGKGRRERVVPIGDGSKRDGGRVLRALRAWINARQPRPGHDTARLFLSWDGLPWSADGASDAVQRLGEASGVNNPIPHRLRHTFCTWYLVAFPGDEIGLRRIVGHLSHDVLADYVHFAQSIVAERAGRASLAEQWLGPGGAPPALRAVSHPYEPPTQTWLKEVL